MLCRGTYLWQKKITSVEKNFSSLSFQKAWAINQSYLEVIRRHIDNQYSSKYYAFSLRISGAMQSSMKKKQGKIRFLDELFFEEVSPDPDFRVNYETETLENRWIGVDVMAPFFYCNFFDKNFFIIVRLIHSISGDLWE